MRLTALVSAAPNVLLGAQRPRILHVPEYVSTAGDQAIEFCGECGLVLDDWQQYVLRVSLGERADGMWAAEEIGLEVPRQNGKGELLEARELVGLFVLDEEELLIHSAHEFATASEALQRMEQRIDENPHLKKRLKGRGVKHSHGEEGVYLKDGSRLRYKTRTKGGGRGFSADWWCLTRR
jgi:hypothetical protein